MNCKVAINGNVILISFLVSCSSANCRFILGSIRGGVLGISRVDGALDLPVGQVEPRGGLLDRAERLNAGRSG